MTSDHGAAGSTSDAGATGIAAQLGAELTVADAEPAESRTAGSSSLETVCLDKYCYAPETACNLGNLKLSECANWQSAEPGVEADATDDYRPPWSGLALGSVDLSAVTATRRARIVALVGATNAGKTSALVAYFVRLRQGHTVDGMRFAGSFTLLGWDQIAHHPEFPPAGTRSFPPHTTSGRSQALLHVRIASHANQLVDVYFTDVPGEWFEEWAYESAEAPGAEWIAERADLFVLLSDTEALQGPERGRARSDYQVLARRVSSVAGEREVLPIRAKSDLGSAPDAISSAVDNTNLSLFGTIAAPMSVIADPPISNPLSPLDDVIRRATAPRPMPAFESGRGPDPFATLRQVQRQT